MNKAKAQNIALWTLQVLGGALFIMAGFNKLSGNEMMVGMFDAIGFGQWFRYLTGAIEVVAGILLFIPALSGVGALLLIPTMLGAIGTHLFIIGGSPAVPAVLLIAMAIVAYGRKERVLSLIKK